MANKYIHTYIHIHTHTYTYAYCPMEVTQAQNNWFDFNETPAYKRGVRRSAYPLYE